MIKKRSAASRSLRQKENESRSPQRTTEENDRINTSKIAEVESKEEEEGAGLASGEGENALLEDLLLFRKWKRKQGTAQQGIASMPDPDAASKNKKKKTGKGGSGSHASGSGSGGSHGKGHQQGGADDEEASMWRLNEGGLVDLEEVRRSRYERQKGEDEDDIDVGGSLSSSRQPGGDANAQTKRIGAAFTASNNALDTEKHMYAFIEAELRKKRRAPQHAGQPSSSQQQPSSSTSAEPQLQDATADDAKDASAAKKEEASEKTKNAEPTKKTVFLLSILSW